MTTRPPWDPRNTRRFRNLAKQTIAKEPTCWLQLPGCTIRSTTADHIIPVSINPTLAMDPRNLHGACRWCNTARNNTPVEQLPELRGRMLQRQAKRTRPAALGFFG